MNLLKIVRKPYLAILMASLILFVSCEQYEYLDTKLLDQQTIEALQKATLEFINNPDNSRIVFNDNDILVDPLLSEAINNFASDDLDVFKQML